MLFAYIVDCGETDPVVDHIYPLKIENFMFRGKVVPVILGCEPRQKCSELVYQTGEWFELYRYPDGVYESPFFFSLLSMIGKGIYPISRILLIVNTRIIKSLINMRRFVN